MRWLVDGMNVIGSRPTGWWRDRQRAQRELIDQLEAFAAATGHDVAVVFDGRPFELSGAGRVEAGFAGRARGAADDAIAEWVTSDSDPGSLTVVTSDSELAGRVRRGGADVVGAGSFRRRLDEAS